MARPRTCSKCKRPAKNHPGRMGPSCQVHKEGNTSPPTTPEPIETSNRFIVGRRKKQADPSPVDVSNILLNGSDVASGGNSVEGGSTTNRGSGEARTKLPPDVSAGPLSVEPLDPPGPARRAGGTPVADNDGLVPPSLSGTSLVPPRISGTSMVPPSMTGTSVVPDAEVSMWARPSTRRNRPSYGILSPRREAYSQHVELPPRREANNKSDHVYGPNGEDMCLVCPGNDNGATPSVNVTHDMLKPIYSRSDKEVLPPRVQRDDGCEPPGGMYTQAASMNGVNDNVNSVNSDRHNMANLSAKLAECTEWLRSPVNIASANVVNKSVVDCLEQVSTLLCKLSMNEHDFNSSQPRREARQLYQSMDPADRPRGTHVPLFTSGQYGQTANGLPARERIHDNGGGVAPQVSRQSGSSSVIGPRMPCGFEAEHGVYNDFTTMRNGGKARFQPGTVQHMVHAQGVAAKSIEQALDGEFCELSDFLSPIGASNNVSPNLECVMDEDNRLLYRTKRYSRKITNCDLWCQAWAMYEKLLIGVFGIELHSVMSDYRQFIMEANRKFMWSAIAMYDFRHRSRLSSRSTLSGRFDFSSPSQDLLVTILDATAVRPNAIRCNRCKAYDHVAAGCPFPETQFKTQEKVKNQNSQIQNEICNNFNRDRCFNERCKRQHKCKQCKGHLPLSKCLLSGACASNSKPAPQQ